MRRPLSSRVETQQPGVAPYGILSPAAQVEYDPKDTWTRSFSYETPDGRVTVVVGGQVGTTTHTVVEGENVPIAREYTPAVVRMSVRSSSFANTFDNLEDSIKAIYKPALQKAIEREFWLGTIAATVEETTYDTTMAEADTRGTRWLDESTAIRVESVVGTPVKAELGLALLEQALGESTVGSKGTLHMPRAVASTIGLDNDETTLLTNLQTPVIAGTGYQMNDALTAWMFATGPITVRYGDAVVIGTESETFDRKTNTYEIAIETPVAVTWSTTNLHAVLVDLSLSE